MKNIKNLITENQKSETFTPTTKNTPNHSKTEITHNFEHCVNYFNKTGKEKFGNHFKIHPADYEIIYKLLVYAIKDVENAEKYNINLKKGILLSGPIGCGKTSIMTLLNQFIPQTERYIMAPCREISFEFIKDGYEVIHKYSRNTIHKKANATSLQTYCFDDLGVENSLKYYGNECNIMAEILLSRYDLFVQKKMITHITTNLNATEIENLYGNRVRSRMREMFNLISFDKETKDKRI